ncbi:Uncharacterised protein [Mycobacterium tuberculosis]|nr:Uncharacterised protein [Mycobacterium tuberculosis]
MPAYRATDDIRQSGTQYVGAAGAIAVIGAPQIGGKGSGEMLLLWDSAPVTAAAWESQRAGPGAVAPG